MSPFIQMFLLIAMSFDRGNADCGHCTAGKLGHNMGSCDDREGCCQDCLSKAHDSYDPCVGTVYTTTAGQTGYFVGSDPHYCEPLHEDCEGIDSLCDLHRYETIQAGHGNLTSPSIVYGSVIISSQAFSPVVLESGLLEGKHKTLDLDRKGQCEGDLQVRLLGDAMPHKSGEKTIKVNHPGECCDLCTGTPGCVGWNAEGYYHCSLLKSTEGKREQCTKSCFSGVDVTYKSKANDQHLKEDASVQV